MSRVAIYVGCTLIPTSEAVSVIEGPHRVLQITPLLDSLILIPIPLGPRKVEGKRQASYYARGFVTLSLSKLTFCLERNEIQITNIEMPAHWNMSDDQLEELTLRSKVAGKERSKNAFRSLLEKRDFKWALISPLVLSERGANSLNPTCLSELDSLVGNRAKEAGVPAGTVFDALHRYYAFGSIKNALLPNTTFRSGAPGQPRRAKNSVKLGRPNALVKAGYQDRAGFILTDKDVQNIEDGYATFVIPGTSIKQAFLSMSATFYSKGHKEIHGHAVPELYSAHERPTEINFRHHGPRGKDGQSAARRLMGDGAWARDYRPLVGTARDGIAMIGQVGSIDASPVDVNFVSCRDPRQPIGVGRGIFVRDAWIGLYFGFHVTQSRLGAKDAKLAILRAATGKADMLQRYGLGDLPEGDFPSIFFSKILSDNGELRCIDGIESIVDQLTSRIEFVASGRADRNSSSESGHHSRHRSFDHHLTGTTKGRIAKRGEPLAISKALITRYAYIRLLILWIHWANTKEQLPLHKIPSEMQRELSSQGKPIARTRIEIYRWASANGYVAGKPMESTFLRSHLLPSFTASVQRNGLVLHRPDTGNAIELLHGARFNHEYLVQSGVIQDMLKKGKKHLEVRADPDDLRQILLVDGRGVHIIPNVTDDALFVREGGVADLCAGNDAQKLRDVLDASATDQDEVEQQSYRKEVEADAQREQQASVKALGRLPKTGAARAMVRTAQVKEVRDQMDDEIRRSSPLRESIATGAATSSFTRDATSISEPKSMAESGRRLTELRKLRLLNAEAEGEQ